MQVQQFLRCGNATAAMQVQQFLRCGNASAAMQVQQFLRCGNASAAMQVQQCKCSIFCGAAMQVQQCRCSKKCRIAAYAAGGVTDGKGHPTDGKGQTPPMEKIRAARACAGGGCSRRVTPPHRWKRSPPTDGKGQRSRAVDSARLMPAFILPGISLLAARFILLSKSVRLR